MKVKVWNDNEHPYTEKYRGDQVTIAAKKYVEMELEDAIMFMGQCSPRVLNADGRDDPKGFKKLRREDPKVTDKKDN